MGEPGGVGPELAVRESGFGGELLVVTSFGGVMRAGDVLVAS